MAITYGTFDLDDRVNWFTQEIRYPTAAPEIGREPYAYREGSARTGRRWPEATVTLEGVLLDQAGVASRFDTAQRILGAGPANLTYATNRYWIAELESLAAVRVSPRFWRWTADFALLDPFAYSVNAIVDNDVVDMVSIGGGQYQKTRVVSPDGSAPARPIYQVSVGGGAVVVSRWELSNTTLGQTMAIQRTFASGDSIVVDTVAMTVKVNGVEVEWSGALPLLERRLGTTNSLRQTATATGGVPTLPMTTTWRPRWLL